MPRKISGLSRQSVWKNSLLCKTADDILIHQYHPCPQLVPDKIDDQAVGIFHYRATWWRILKTLLLAFANYCQAETMSEWHKSMNCELIMIRFEQEKAMPCNTIGCQAIHNFVKPLLHNRPEITWSAFDPHDEHAVYLKVWLSERVEQLRLEYPGDVLFLSEATQKKIHDWLNETFSAGTAM
jgi:hypothetical protein